jgi:phenylalanyl-tRNA synthetase beta chain
MKISRNWLNKYIELPDDQKLISTLTFSGIEVEAVIQMPALPASVVTAKVIEAKRIEGSDHLVVCAVDYGATEHIQVVCGAPNCREGMITLLALPGSTLSGLTIKKTTIRGVESSGMLCSEKELGVSDNHSGIVDLGNDVPIGVSANIHYELPDTIFELEITPNRPDLLGYLGIARDLSASLKVPFIQPQLKEIEGVISSDKDFKLIVRDAVKCPRYTARLIDGVSIQESPQWLKSSLIKTGLRPINNIVDITNFVMLETGHPLHAFDYSKLLPLNDQDMYPAIVVRCADNEEHFLALDGKTYLLDSNDLVIADGQNPSALAGVIGGKQSAISESTSTIVLESAAFSPMAVRSTSYKHKISTDSSYRFERHQSPEMALNASNRALELILATAGGKVCNSLYDEYPHPVTQMFLALRPRRYSELIGYPLDEEKIIKYLEALGCKFIQYGSWQSEPVYDMLQILCHHSEEVKAGKTEFSEIDCDHALYFQIPPNRVDITREVDLIEELARLDGYDKVPQKKTLAAIMDRHAYMVQRKIADHFIDCGFYEMLNYSYSDPTQFALMAGEPDETNEKVIRLINPQSTNQSAMRVNLLPQLLGNMVYNINHGERNLRLIELGKTYIRDGKSYIEPLRLTAVLTGRATSEHWTAKPAMLSLPYVKGIVESLLQNLNLCYRLSSDDVMPWLIESDTLSFESGGSCCATLGRLKSHLAEKAGIDITVLKQDIWVIDIDIESITETTRKLKTEFQPLSKYPAVIRDVSFVIGAGIAYTEIAEQIKAIDSKLIKQVSVFDEYRGKQVPDGCRSLSLHIMLQDIENTLTDECVDQVIASVLKKLEDTWQIVMR